MTVFLLVWFFFGACAAILNGAVIRAIDKNFGLPKTSILSAEIGVAGIVAFGLGVFAAGGMVFAFFFNKMAYGKNWPHNFWR